MDASLRNDVGVEAVAKVNRVDIVTVKNGSALDDSNMPAQIKTARATQA